MKTKILETITSMIDRRDHLIYKRLAGEKLSFFEERYVILVDSLVKNTLPIPNILSGNIKQTAQEINLLIDSRR